MIVVVPQADSHSFCTHSSDPQELFSRAAVCSQSVLLCGVSLAQVCTFLFLTGNLLLAQSSSLSRFLGVDALLYGISFSPFPSSILSLCLQWMRSVSSFSLLIRISNKNNSWSCSAVYRPPAKLLISSLWA